MSKKATWRPKDWNKRKPKVGTRYNDLVKIKTVQQCVIARNAYEAGADALFIDFIAWLEDNNCETVTGGLLIRRDVWQPLKGQK